MKRYELKRELPTFKAGDVFIAVEGGNLVHENDNVVAYSSYTLEKFPNILTDWFEEIKDSTRWKPEVNHAYCFIGSECGEVYYDVWTGSIDQERFDWGNCFQTEEEAERVVEYLKALATVRGDATRKFVKGKSNWYVYYNTNSNLLCSSICCSMLDNGIFGLPYFATKEDAQRSIKLHKKEWLTIFGIEDDETQK